MGDTPESLSGWDGSPASASATNCDSGWREPELAGDDSDLPLGHHVTDGRPEVLFQRLQPALHAGPDYPHPHTSPQTSASSVTPVANSKSSSTTTTQARSDSGSPSV